MGFKLLRGYDSDLTLTVADNTTLIFHQQRFQNDVDFCFQFNDDEPIVFGSGPNDLHINISPTPNGNMVFTNNNGETFKIFARERQ
jgi:hypothetical protein